MEVRRPLYENILLSGGTTMLRGFPERLLSEVQRSVAYGAEGTNGPSGGGSGGGPAVSSVRIRMTAPPERRYGTWVGGSILAALASFRNMWVSAAEYEEHGPQLLHKRCFV